MRRPTSVTLNPQEVKALLYRLEGAATDPVPADYAFHLHRVMMKLWPSVEKRNV